MIEITEIVPQKRNKDRFSLYSFGEFVLGLSSESIVRHKIKVGSNLTDEFIDSIKREDTLVYAKSLCGMYLGRAPHTNAQLLEYLEKKGVDTQTALDAAALMKEYGYIDDEAYAAEFVRMYSSRMGKQALIHKLCSRGIEKDIAQNAVEDVDSKEAARNLISKLSQKYSELPPQKRRQKLYAALIRRGFSYSEISDLICEYSED